MQERKPIAYFSEKVNGPVLNCSTYDKELMPLCDHLKCGNIISGPKNLLFILIMSPLSIFAVK
jgi:hypothetical protein